MTVVLLSNSCEPSRAILTLMEDEIIAYQISMIHMGKGSYHLRIDGILNGNASGETDLVLPSSWGGKQKLFKAVRNLSSISEGVTGTWSADSIYTLQHEPDQLINFSYELVPLFAGDLIKRDSAYLQLMQKDYFHFIGTTAFVYPSLAMDPEKSMVSLSWKGFPNQWAIHNSYGAGHERQRLEANDGRWLQAVFVGGDFRTHRLEVKENQVDLALRGTWNFPDSVLVTKLKRIITTQRDFWNDHSDPYYTVTLIPLNDSTQCCSYMGTGLTHSFATFAHNFEGVLGGLEYLFSHELMHHWIGSTIQNDQPEELKYWFSEGFTDYFTQLILRECGFVDTAGFVSNINKLLMEHYASSVREATNEDIKTNFWLNPEFERLPYRRGAIFAFYLDAAIKEHSQNEYELKDAMKDLLEVCKNKQLVLTDSLFLSRIREYLPQDLKTFMQVHLDQGHLIELNPNSLGPQFDLTYKPVMEYDLGFDFERSKTTNRIVGVRQGSAAYASGLRDGQQLTGYSVAYGNMTKLINLTVVSDGISIDIKYLPQREKPELGLVPQFVARPTSSELLL